MLRKRSSIASRAAAQVGVRQKILDPHWHAVFLFAAVGLGVAVHCGLRWYELPRYSGADIEQSAQLNFAIDQARLGNQPSMPANQRQQLLEHERTEVKNDIDQERQGLRAEAGLALILLVLAAGQTVAARLNARRRSG